MSVNKVEGRFGEEGETAAVRLDMKKTGYVLRTNRQRLTAQDSHVQPGVDVGQLILKKQKRKV